MQFLSTILSVSALLLPLVSATACVAGGPAAQVTFAKNCCLGNYGTWYQFYEVQAICVMADAKENAYKRCISLIQNSKLDTTCIPGDGGIQLGDGVSLTTTARTTYTGAPASTTLVVGS